jgi:hypothetical protein
MTDLKSLTYIERCAAIASGQTLQNRIKGDATMLWQDHHQRINTISIENDSVDWQIKPKEKHYVERTIRYPAPEAVAPKQGTACFYIHVLNFSGINQKPWAGTVWEYGALDRGMVFLNEADAKEAAKAIFGIEK